MMIVLIKLIFIRTIFLDISDWNMLPCLSQQLFNISCPGCGIQRSFINLINGNLYQAFILYPAIFFIIALSITVFISLFIKKKSIQKSINILAILSISTIFINYFIKLII
jgi:hypothetical protein